LGHARTCRRLNMTSPSSRPPSPLLEQFPSSRSHPSAPVSVESSTEACHGNRCGRGKSVEQRGRRTDPVLPVITSSISISLSEQSNTFFSFSIAKIIRAAHYLISFLFVISSDLCRSLPHYTTSSIPFKCS